MIKMKKYEKYIIEDLLPLYEEGLLSEETKEWLEVQLKKNEEYQRLHEKMQQPLEKQTFRKSMRQNKTKCLRKFIGNYQFTSLFLLPLPSF